MFDCVGKTVGLDGNGLTRSRHERVVLVRVDQVKMAQRRVCEARREVPLDQSGLPIAPQECPMARLERVYGVER